MFILNFIPSWFFPALAILAILIFLISKFIKLPQAQLIHYASIAVFALALFMSGANWNNDYWLAKVKEVEAKLAEAQAESAKENTKIVEKVVTKREIVRVQGSDIIKYVDREKIVIDESCKIPPPVVEAHNRATKPPEDKK
jgi:hypothetical protein